MIQSLMWHQGTMKMGAVKNIVYKLVVVPISVVADWVGSFNKKEEVDNPNFYSDLTPIDYADADNKYSEAISWALKNENVKNIAITGPYGSGKSSVLRTYEKNHPEYNFLNISLGSFKEKLTGSEENLNLLIEKSILQQIFYRVRKKVIPYSRFNRIKNVNFLSYSITSGLIALWLSTLLFIYEHDNPQIADVIKNSGIPKNWDIYAALTIAFLGLIFIIQELFKFFSQSKVNKIGLTTGQLEFNEVLGDSILNKHLDEIIYFFEKTGFNVVIIEDLDRFEEVDIFIKLREINTLLNNSDQIRRKIVFIYAIKDEIFKDTNRTKFFDFIIPIIPVINASNSGEMLNRMLSATLPSGETDSIPKDFVSDITFYIDDMRMLKNIFNEFVLYRNKLSAVSGIELRNDKLLGFIVYKNKYPDDFAKLNANKGIVAKAFNNKSALIQKRGLDIENQIQLQEKELSQVENERLSSIKELRTIYVAGLFQTVTNLSAILLNGGRYGFSELLSDDLFKQYRESTQITYYIGNNTNTTFIDFESIQNTINPETSYLRREELINKKSIANVDAAKRKIESLKGEIRDIRSSSLQDLINSLPIEQAFETNELSHDLLIYLIRNGYIDEMYHTFISYFYEGNITKSDMAFILSVKNKSPLSFNHQLVKTQAVLDKLNPADFKSKAIFNFDLVHHLLADPKNFAYLEFVLLQISNASKSSLEFLDAYLTIQESKDLLMNKLCKKWGGIWKSIHSDSGYSSEKIDAYLKLMILYADVDDLVRIDSDNLLSDYISDKANFMYFTSDIKDLPKLKEIIKKLQIQFKRLDESYTNKPLFEYIYESSAYEINAEMINSIINYYPPEGFTVLSLEMSNYTTILKSKCTHLIQYVKDNLNDYVEYVLLPLLLNNNESEKTVIELLNSKEIKDTNKIAILKKENAKITNITDLVDLDIWGNVLSSSKLIAKWENVLEYFKSTEFTFDEALISFLNNEENSVLLSNQRLSTSTENVDKLSIKLMLCDSLSDQSYMRLVYPIPLSYSQISGVDALPASKVRALLKTGRFQLTLVNFNFLKTSLNDEYALLLQSNLKAYLDKINEFALDSSGLQFLMASTEISNDQKLTILKSVVDVSIFDQKLELSKLVFKLILGYEKVAVLSLDLMEVLFKQKGIPVEDKVKIFNSQVDHIDILIAKELLGYIGEPISGILTNQQPKLDNNDTYLEFANSLKKIGLLSSFNVKDKKIRLFPKKS